MIYKEFLKKIKENGISIYGDKNEKYFSYEPLQKLRIKREGFYLCCTWDGGGTCGNCWDDQLRSIEPSESKELDDLDRVLKIFGEGISFLQYKEIIREVVHTDSHGDDDYYGGSTMTWVKYLFLEDLYDELVKIGIIKCQQEK